MQPTYRQWLQDRYNSSTDATVRQQAGALLNVVGDDGGINQNFIANPYSYTGRDDGQMRDYGPDGMTRINNEMLSAYNSPNRQYSGNYADYPSQVNGTSTVYGGGSGGTGGSYNPADLAYLDDQRARLDRQKGSIDAAEQNGLTQLGDDYNREVSSANQKQSRALEDFQVKRDDTTSAKNSAIGRVDSNARTLADSLRRRLGMAFGNGSALEVANSAVARDASKNRTGVVENYGRNFRDLATAEDRVNTDFQSLLGDLDSQRKQRESDFRAGILDRRNQVDNSLSEVARQRALLMGGGYTQAKTAMAPYASAIDTRQSEIDGLFNKYRTPYNVKPVDVSAPNLRDYTVDRATIGGGQGQQGQYEPYSQFLKKQTDDEKLY